MFALQTYKTVFDLYGIYAIENDLLTYIELYGTIIAKIDNDSERIEHFLQAQQIILDMWEAMQTFPEFDDLVRKTFDIDFAIKIAIDFLRLILQSNSERMMVTCVAWLIPDLMLNFMPISKL